MSNWTRTKVPFYTLHQAVKDEFSIDMTPQEHSDVAALIRDLDEGELAIYLDGLADGGLTRDSHVAVSNLLADFSEPDWQRSYKPDGNNELAF